MNIQYPTRNVQCPSRVPTSAQMRPMGLGQQGTEIVAAASLPPTAKQILSEAGTPPLLFSVVIARPAKQDEATQPKQCHYWVASLTMFARNDGCGGRVSSRAAQTGQRPIRTNVAGLKTPKGFFLQPGVARIRATPGTSRTESTTPRGLPRTAPRLMQPPWG